MVRQVRCADCAHSRPPVNMDGSVSPQGLCRCVRPGGGRRSEWGHKLHACPWYEQNIMQKQDKVTG